MTNIDVYGHSTKISNIEIAYAAGFMLDLLLKEKVKLVHSIDICFEKERGSLGSVVPLDDNQTEFELIIAPKQSYKNIIGALAHELVHVKQFVTKELMDCNSRLIWKGKLISGNIDYWEAPHEIEAYGREPGLVCRYLHHIKENKLKFDPPKKRQKR